MESEHSLREGEFPDFSCEKNRRLIVDCGRIITAYPLITWAGGGQATMTITAAEAPFSKEKGKLERNDPLAGLLPGFEDKIICDPKAKSPQSWQPEWIRAMRYLVIDIEVDPTAASPLVVEFPKIFASYYPLPQTLEVSIDDGQDWPRLIEVNRATAAACAHETFFDCPAWEQAQFPGDGRIQARHHYIVGNDDRLGLKAIRDCAASISPSGLLHSHWPSSFEQIIATYSLQWIGMLSDHLQHFNRPQALAEFLPTARGIMAWFVNRSRSDGLLAHIAEAPFMDWAFPAGCAPQTEEGGSAMLTSLAAESMSMLADLEQAAGYPELAPRWQQQAAAWCAGGAPVLG